MSKYIELKVTVNPAEPWSDLLAHELGGIGFESFTFDEKGFQAYVNEQAYDEGQLKLVFEQYGAQCEITYDQHELKVENWNEEWEKNFAPVMIGKECIIRAPFHDPAPEYDYEILMSPKMAFGTGHHATTYLVAAQLLKMDLQDQTVLDMGCGTAVLAILAEKRGAKGLLAVDNDEWAYANALENIDLNDCHEITAVHGDAAILEGKQFNVILANINRNILIRDMAEYNNALTPSGALIMSGFYEIDLPIILRHAETLGFTNVEHAVRDQWTMVHLVKADA